jgi:molybdenum cofactor biosynthesis enzyme MoaA
VAELENVYLAGGEPMLMKENHEFLTLLKDKNPNCNVRVNTNLSTTGTGIFELLCQFKNVHWTISVESIEQEYEYIRHHGSWHDFLSNLETVRKLDHKISFNMLHFILNHASVHDCVDLLKAKGFHDNSFIIGPLYTPEYLNTLNLPSHMLETTKDLLKAKLNNNPVGYLKNSYENCLKYLSETDWSKDIDSFYKNIKILDQRRGIDSKRTFKKLFGDLDA